MDILISKITIKIGDTTVELTVEQAKELQKALNDLLGNQVTWSYYPYTTITYPPYTIYYNTNKYDGNQTIEIK